MRRLMACALCLLIAAAVPLLAGSCVRYPASAPAAPSDQDLISALLLPKLEALSEEPDSADLAVWRVFAPTADSALALHRASWVSWWYTVRDNHLELSPRLRARFARRFNLADPPPDPYARLDHTYRVSNVRRLDNNRVSATLGVSYAACTYTFERRDRRWQLVPGSARECWIS